MEKFETLDGIAVPLDRANVDTDAIIPKQFLKSIKRSGFGPNLFDEWRWLDPGDPGIDNSKRRPNPDFVLNQSRYQGATILLARDNFGCGSSREHAVWALADFGIRAVIAPSYADIFFNNCFKNGVLPIVLPPADVDRLFTEVEATPGYRLRIDLPSQSVTLPSGAVIEFDIEPYRKDRLLQGLDEIGVTLSRRDRILAYEERRRREAPWLFGAGARA
jgi:3-isopropylmalate/(R)-2-methylmalate dehydratase small subunit